MVDIGDLREGVWPDHVNEVVKGMANLPSVEVVGLGCNLACYGGVIPNHENMQMLVDIRDECTRVTGLELPVLSGRIVLVYLFCLMGKCQRRSTIIALVKQSYWVET